MKESRTNVSLEARAKEITDNLVRSYWEQTHKPTTDDTLRNLYQNALLQFASEVSAETARRVREETIRECVEMICGHVCYSEETLNMLSKVATEILSLLLATPKQEGKE